MSQTLAHGDHMRKTLKRTAAVAGAAAVVGIGYVAMNWYRYGRPGDNEQPDPLLDRFMPSYDVRDFHATQIAAPAAITYQVAREMDIHESRLVRGIFRGREVLMRARHEPQREPQSLLEETLALGWGVLAEETGHEIVVGAVTRPWEADVRFASVPPDAFRAFATPGYVKIAWTLSAEPLGEATSEFRTETRVMTTDADARARFRRYWSVMAPGIGLIRRQSLGLVRAEAERRYRDQLNNAPSQW